MIKEIKLPEIAENVDTAVVLNIMVSEGDKIEKDDTIAEMESDKATFDLPSSEAGTVKEIKIKEDDEVKVGQVVLTVETEDEETSGAEEEGEDEGQENEGQGKEEGKEEKKGKADQKEAKEEEPSESEKKEKEDESSDEETEGQEKEETKEEKKENVYLSEKDEEEEPSESEKRETEEKEKEREEREEQASEGAGEVPASPSVRRLARELGVKITKVEGTGPYDRITPEDVKSYAKEIVSQSDKEAAGEELPDFSKWGNVRREKLDSIRRRVGKNMKSSWNTIPHVFQFDKADVTDLEKFREKQSKRLEKKGIKLSVTAILIKIVAAALKEFPKFNASIDVNRGEVIYKDFIHLGVAVDTDRGLLVPVIKDADKKGIRKLAAELSDIASRAREKKIKPEELQGGNFAISNLGGIGGTGFTPIVYKPNVAVLGVSRTATEARFIEGEFKPRLILPLSLSYDHRLIDGAEGAAFLRWICDALENPLLALFGEGGEDE